MFRMCASNSHSYTHLIQALGIVRKPTLWGFITSKYPGTHDIGLPNIRVVCRKTPMPFRRGFPTTDLELQAKTCHLDLTTYMLLSAY